MVEHPHRVVTAIVVAAGRGVRAGGEVPKQWQSIAGKTVADWTLATFADHREVDEVIVVINPDDDEAKTVLSNWPNLKTASGGATRDASVLAGLNACSPDTTLVLIHDIARPCVSPELISAVIDALDINHAAAPALPVTDALWIGHNQQVTGTQDRTSLFRAQTPQGFSFEHIIAAHKAHIGRAADDVEVARGAGLEVRIVPGEERNLKITTHEDFDRAAQYLAGSKGEDRMDIRVGNGFDVHRFGDGTFVTLCGLEIPHSRGLQGHSDADVGLHTITDAIYGALAQGDIGQHFPPSDPQWKGAASYIFLEHARDLAKSKGFNISHVDCTLICEFPKIGPHTLNMRHKVSELLNIEEDRVSVKATTSERLGFTGREEGIACMATATLVKS
jgi:2-C-methyl-D-erythritol 4-phosphate cytidylyltransferase/2-C-methyl-D-erythritol 2,4-cyclodiphosphate synthase